MPNIFGASLLDILSQGGQFLGGRRAAQQEAALAAEKRKEDSALAQALMAQRNAAADADRALAEARRARSPEQEVPIGARLAKAEGQLAPFANKATPQGFDPVGAQVSDAIAHLGLPNVDPTMLFKVAQERADAKAQVKPTGPVRGTPEYEAMLRREQAIIDGNSNAAAGGLGGGTATVAKQRAGMLYTAGKGGYDTLESVLAEADKNAPSWMEQQASKLPFGVGNVATTPFMRQLQQGANQLSDAWLRLTSGAAVPETEVERFAAGFLPVAGDDPITSANKAKARATIIEAMRVAGGASVDVAEGIRAAGIDPRDVDAVSAWVQQNAGGADTAAAAAGGGDLRSRFRARIGGGG